eukprot:SAG11_NODE_2963_length_2807_cov_4.781019_5_plen_46_part_00
MELQTVRDASSVFQAASSAEAESQIEELTQNNVRQTSLVTTDCDC